jgi:hypothetical protein
MAPEEVAPVSVAAQVFNESGRKWREKEKAREREKARIIQNFSKSSMKINNTCMYIHVLVGEWKQTNGQEQVSPGSNLKHPAQPGVVHLQGRLHGQQIWVVDRFTALPRQFIEPVLLGGNVHRQYYAFNHRRL